MSLCVSRVCVWYMCTGLAGCVTRRALLLSGPCEGLCVPLTVLLSLAGVSVSTGAKGGGFGLVVGNYLCDTQAGALGCPGEQSPWSDRNNHLLCARVCGQAVEAERWGWGQLRPPWPRMPCSRFGP